MAVLTVQRALSWSAALVVLLAAPAAARAVTISPLPGTPDASPQTQISILGAPASEISSVSVIGSRSGAHGGRLEPYSTGTGASFVLGRALDPGERVQVVARVSGRAAGTTFTVARPVPWVFAASTKHPAARPGYVQRFISDPSLQPPAV